MKKTLTAKTSVSIHATPSKVWKALTTPDLIKKYLMGTNVSSDWKEGSPVNYEGDIRAKNIMIRVLLKRLSLKKFYKAPIGAPWVVKKINRKIITW